MPCVIERCQTRATDKHVRPKAGKHLIRVIRLWGDFSSFPALLNTVLHNINAEQIRCLLYMSPNL